MRGVQNVFSPFQAFRSWGKRRSPTRGPLRCCQRLTKKKMSILSSAAPHHHILIHSAAPETCTTAIFYFHPHTDKETVPKT